MLKVKAGDDLTMKEVLSIDVSRIPGWEDLKESLVELAEAKQSLSELRRKAMGAT
jgi:hypothetical protein